MSLENIRAAFDIGTAREELSGSPFASARNMATNAARAFGGQGDPEAPICRFVDSAIRLHGEAIAALAAAPGDDSAYLKSELATFRGLLAAARGELALELRPMPGERVDNDGAAIRSNRAWRELAAVAIKASGEARAEARDSTESLHAINAELAEAREALADWHGKALAYQEQRNAESARAVKAERQLAEYRSLMAALPAGMAFRYPAALPLLRAYLADTESE